MMSPVSASRVASLPSVSSWPWCRLVVWLGGVLAALAWSPAAAQPRPSAPDYVEHRWTVMEGLPANAVREVHQPPGGMLWVGAERGVRRFNGTTFRRFPTTEMTDTLMAGGRVEHLEPWQDGMLVEYRGGALAYVTRRHATLLVTQSTAYDAGDEAVWVGTNDALLRVDAQGRTTPAAPALSGRTARGLLRTRDGTLWIATDRHGLFRRTPDGTLRPVPNTNALTAETVVLAEGPDGAVYIGSNAGLHRWANGRLRSLPAAPSVPTPERVTDIAPQVQGSCWARTPQGIYRCREDQLVPYGPAAPPTRTPQSVFPSSDFVFTGADDALFVHTGTRLYRNGTQIFAAEQFIRSVIEDREGTLWVGTDSEGLVRLRPSRIRVFGEAEGLPENSILTILERRNGSVWMGDARGNLVQMHDDGPIAYRLRKDGAPLNHIWTLHEDRTGQMWAGGTHVCRVVNGQCAEPDAPGPLSSALITSIEDDDQGRLWVGTLRSGLYRREAAPPGADASWTHLTPANSPLPGRRVRWIHRAPSGALWLSVPQRGLVRWTGDGVDVLGTDLLDARQPGFIYQDRPGVLWVATSASGLRRVDLRDAETLDDAHITDYHIDDGLPHESIYQILSDDQGRFWMNSPRGLFWVRRAALNAVANGTAQRVRAVTYSTRDGLRNVEGNGFGTPGAARTPDGRLWFPTIAGAATLTPAAVPLAPPPPPLRIEGVSVDDTLVSVPDTTTVRLDNTQRTFHITYAGLRLQDPSDVTYRYRLVGLQNEWTYAHNRRSAFFTQVPPGRYTFEVQARTHLGPWSPETARLSLAVAPFWWETWGFYALLALALGGLVLGMYQWRTRRLRRRRDELEEEVQVRTREVHDQKDQLAEQADRLRELDTAKSRFFANITHEFQTPLTLIQGPVQQVREHLQNGTLVPNASAAANDDAHLAIVQRNTQRLQLLVEQLLGLARLEAGTYTLSARPIPAAPTLEHITRDFSVLADRESIAFHVSLPPRRAPDAPSLYADPDALDHIVRNLLSNAFKYTPAEGRVALEAQNTDTGFQVSVHDTGPGIPAEEQRTILERFERGSSAVGSDGMGIGLAFVSDLVELHHGSLSLESAVGEGTTVTVRLPWGTDHLSPDQLSDDPSPPDVPSPVTAAPKRDAVSGDALPDPAAHPEDDSLPADAEDAPDPERILLVDDNPDLRRFVSDILTPTYEVLGAQDAHRGLDRAQSALPDLILTDVMMPGMDGHELTRRLRENPTTRSIPILMLTARSTPQDEVEGLQHGADDYIQKPFEADVLRQRIASVFAAQRRLRQAVREGTAPTAPLPDTNDRSPFEEKARAVVRDHLSDPDLDVVTLMDELAISRSTLYRRFRNHTDTTPGALILAVRMEEARHLLRQGSGTVTEIAYAVGYQRLSSFSRDFREHTGVIPSALPPDSSTSS